VSTSRDEELSPWTAFEMGKGPKATKASKILAKVRKDMKTKSKPAKGVTMRRRDATIVLTQGAVAAPRQNFGSRVPGKMSTSKMIQCLDARVPRTLGLPRAVGPYTVMRTTVLHKSSSRYIQFCPFLSDADPAAPRARWYNWCGVEAVTSTSGITAADNTKAIAMPLSGLGDSCELVPAALTVQVMNDNALDNANGIFAMGRVNQALALGESDATLLYDDMIARFISFYSPRMLTGGKLCLRGVKSSAYPINMNEYAEFAPVHEHNTVFTWSPIQKPAALAPIVFAQLTDTPVNIQFMVTIEWRVRFDPGNPATATHTHHDTLADEAWNDVVKTMSAVGHGVEELSEDTAAAGALGLAARGAAALV